MNDWNTSLKKGQLGEEKIKEMLSKDFYPYLCQPQILHCLFEEYESIQKSGVDMILSFPTLKLEIKTRDAWTYQFKDILLETKSVVVGKETKKLGWLWTSQADLILYLWWSDETRQKFVDGYILLIKKIRDMAKRIKWESKISPKIAPNQGYITESIPISIDLLKSLYLIYPIKKDYNLILQKWFV